MLNINHEDGFGTDEEMALNYLQFKNWEKTIQYSSLLKKIGKLNARTNLALHLGQEENQKLLDDLAKKEDV